MGSNICFQLSDDRDLQEFVWAALGVEAFMLVFFHFAKAYDLSTAMFVAFALGALARGKFKTFYTIYAVSCLNRETMFLITVFFAVYYFWRMGVIEYLFGLGCQGVAFIGVRLFITMLYADNPGRPVWFGPLQVLADYLAQPLQSLALIGLCVLIGCFVARHWARKPLFLRWALIVILPLQIVLHLALGMAFEIRVFAEVFPVVWVLLRSDL
jgi:hypothetical protein